jgi:hypothetical protein
MTIMNSKRVFLPADQELDSVPAVQRMAYRAMGEVHQTLATLIAWLGNQAAPLPSELHDQISCQLMAMLGDAQLLCQRTAETVATSTDADAQAMAQAYLNQAELLALQRADLRRWLQANRPPQYLDPSLRQLLARVRLQPDRLA